MKGPESPDKLPEYFPGKLQFVTTAFWPFQVNIHFWGYDSRIFPVGHNCHLTIIKVETFWFPVAAADCVYLVACSLYFALDPQNEKFKKVPL